MQKLSKQLSEIRKRLEDVHEDHISGVMAEDLSAHVEAALEHLAEVAGDLREAGL